jgi:hypothetical protein
VGGGEPPFPTVEIVIVASPFPAWQPFNVKVITQTENLEVGKGGLPPLISSRFNLHDLILSLLTKLLFHAKCRKYLIARQRYVEWLYD